MQPDVIDDGARQVVNRLGGRPDQTRPMAQDAMKRMRRACRRRASDTMRRRIVRQQYPAAIGRMAVHLMRERGHAAHADQRGQHSEGDKAKLATDPAEHQQAKVVSPS